MVANISRYSIGKNFWGGKLWTQNYFVGRIDNVSKDAFF